MNTNNMATPVKEQPISEEALLKRQRKGAMITATIVAVIALAIFLFTLYMNATKG